MKTEKAPRNRVMATGGGIRIDSILGFAWLRCLENVPKIFSQMVVKNGDLP